jgi:hypothetical protein
MPNEFVIKNGFISQGNSIVTGNINVSSGLSANTISATTYINVPTFTGGTISGGLTATTISATTYQNLPIDIRVTGGTYDNSSGVATFSNNTGGTFNVVGFFTGSTTSSFDYGKSYVIANNYQWF